MTWGLLLLWKNSQESIKRKYCDSPISPTTESYLAFTRKVGEHSLASDTFWEYLNQEEN